MELRRQLAKVGSCFEFYQQLLPLLLSTADDHQHAFKQLGQTLALNFEIKIVSNLIDFPSTP